MEKSNKGLANANNTKKEAITNAPKKKKPTVKATKNISTAAYNRALKEIALMEKLLKSVYDAADTLLDRLDYSDDPTSYKLASKISHATLMYAEHNKDVLAERKAKLK